MGIGRLTPLTGGERKKKKLNMKKKPPSKGKTASGTKSHLRSIKKAKKKRKM